MSRDDTARHRVVFRFDHDAFNPIAGAKFAVGVVVASGLTAFTLAAAGTYLVDNDHAFVQSFWRIGTATLLAALPILAIVVFGERADRALPGIREWMDRNSWLISIVVYVFFIYALLS